MKIKDKAAYILCYGLAALALVFYLVTLYQGMNPHPCAAYQAFYLDQELYTWPGIDGFNIVKGQMIHFDSKTGGAGQGAGHIMRREDSCWNEPDGWSYAQEQGYCITGWRSRLLFAGDALSSYHVSMTLSSPQPGGEITIFVNGEEALFAQFPDEEMTFEFDTPVLPEDGRLEMELVLGGDLGTPVCVKEMIFT